MKYFILPRLRDILFFSIFLAAVALGPRMLNMDGDLPRHLAIGKYVLQGHLPPTNDIFSHTREGAPFAPHKWLSGVLFYLSYISFSEVGIVVLSAAALAGTFALIYVDRVALLGNRLPIFFLTVFGAAVSSLHWIARPHIFTMLLLAIWLVLADKQARGQKVPWWALPLVMLVWNNIHGEYIAGLIVLAAYLAGWVWDYLFNRAETSLATGKALALSLGASIAVSILNPISFRAWSTVTTWLGNDYLMERTQETAPPNFAQGQFYILLLFLAFSVFLLALKKSKLSTGQSILLAGFTVMVLNSARNVHLYGIVAPFVLAAALPGLTPLKLLEPWEEKIGQIESSLKGIAWPIGTVLLTLILLLTTPLGSAQRFSPSYFPIDAVEWLRTNPQEGNMFNPFDWGGYISLEVWPEYRVFIDSQGDVYGEAFIRQYEQVITLQPGWQSVLEEYNVTWAMVPRDWPLSLSLASEGWEEVYRDGTTVILRHP